MKYYGKEKCKILKQIRAEIAKNNDIEWMIDECEHKGNCTGTCPKCEAEVRELERKLEERKRLGKAVAVAGVAAGIALSVTGCMTTVTDGVPVQDTTSETSVPETTDTETETETEADTDTYEELEGEPVELLGDVDGGELTVETDDNDPYLMGDIIEMPEPNNAEKEADND